MRRWSFLAAVLVAVAAAALTRPLVAGKAGEGTLELTIVDQQTRQPIACRVHLVNAAGVPRRPLKCPFWYDHFVCPGQVSLRVPRGNYTFLIERGGEYADATGYFTINDFADDRKTAELKRACDMASEGWWAADLRVRRVPRDIELLMQAEDLHLVVDLPPASEEPEAVKRFKPGSMEFEGQRYCQLLEPQDKTTGGRLAIDLGAGFDKDGEGGQAAAGENAAEKTSDAQPAASAQASDEDRGRWWYDVDNPAAPELPVWLALGQVDSLSLLGGELLHGKYEPNKKSVRKRADDSRAAAELAQQVYFQILECGLRLPPSAGSESGVSANPVGYDRMYAWVDKEDFNRDRWWRAVRLGRVTVTNGPLIRPTAGGRLPGHEFQLLAGQLELDVAMNLTTRDPITYLELIKNGRTAASIRLSDWAKTGHFPAVRFNEPGWMLVRVVTDVQQTYRAALSAPWYVAGTGGPRISRKAVHFFLDRLKPLAAATGSGDKATVSPAQLAAAERFWTELLAKANAD
ncbi:MAG TPA: hypothetical protein VHY20_06095 [Pirellulales bacterium]|nr:hypothetical protein [Pirellulales bacterium]